MNKLILATGNAGKIKEMAFQLAPLGIELIGQKQAAADAGIEFVECVEDGLSFIENAIKKARHAAKLTGCAAIADDSGLAVDALQGAPGIYSARYAGDNASDQDNIDKLLSALKDEKQRNAQFHCALAFVKHENDPTPLVIHKFWAGSILEQQQGEGGFGYDPVFYAKEFNCAAALLTKEQKSSVSHRGQAVKAFIEYLKAQ